MKLKLLFFSIVFLCGYSWAGLEDLSQFSTAIFQAGGLNGEGFHPSFVSHAPAEEIIQALGEIYSNTSNKIPLDKNRSISKPESIQVLVPDSMSHEQSEAYRKSIQEQLYQVGLTEVHVILVIVPILKMLSESEDLIAKSETLSRDNPEASQNDILIMQRFYRALSMKMGDLKLWANRMAHWKDWKQNIKNKWSNRSIQEKDKAVLTVFGALKGVPGVLVYADDAGINPINIVRMVLAYAADVFFTISSRAVTNFPSKMRFPDLKERTINTIGWASSFGLMALGYGGVEAHPSNIIFQLSHVTPFIKNWYDRTVEVRSFLFSYSLSLGIPFTFLTLGYFAKGGEASGSLSPFDISFLLEFAGLQMTNGVMGTLGGRGNRVLAEKTYTSGRQENILYVFYGLLSQATSISIATGNTTFYRSLLAVKTVLQGLTFLVSRALPAKAPNVFIFHASIGERERKSLLYTEGIMSPQEVGSFDQLMSRIVAETHGPSSVNRVIGLLGKVFQKNQWTSYFSSNEGLGLRLCSEL